MSFRPDFIADFHDEIGEPEINKKLRDLAFEFNEKYDHLEKNKRTQSAWRRERQFHMGHEGKGTDFDTMQRHLKNEYKIKVQEISKAHIEEEKFEELTKKHALEYTKEEIKVMEEEKAKDTISASQEKMMQIKAERAERKVALINELETQVGQKMEMAKQGNEQKNDNSELSDRERRKAELMKQFDINKSMTRER